MSLHIVFAPVSNIDRRASLIKRMAVVGCVCRDKGAQIAGEAKSKQSSTNTNSVVLSSSRNNTAPSRTPRLTLWTPHEVALLLKFHIRYGEAVG